MKDKSEIFRILEQDARTSHKEIASRTGIPLKDVVKIIGEAEAAGAIVKYRTMVDWEKLGEQQVMALIEVKVIPERGVGFDAIAERISRHAEARSVFLVSGGYDFGVMVTGKDIYEISRFVGDKLSTIEGVQGTVTHFFLKRYKQDGEILTARKRSRRLPFTP
jgi:DNA-binding Lrp family transcriptional regulator